MNKIFTPFLVLLIFKTSFGQATEPSQQPSNLQFSSITSYSLSLSFTASVADGYLVLKNDKNITDVPADGITYEKGQGLSSSKVAYIGANTALPAREILEGTRYYFKVFAYNGSGSSINYKQTSPLSDSVLIPASNAGSYYNAIDSNAATFIDDLHNLINTHSVVAYTMYKYNIIPAIFERDTVGGQCVVNCEYSNETTVYTPPFDFVALDYSREHVICKSWMKTYPNYGSNITQQPEGADYYNLLLTRLNGVNQLRSNNSLGVPVSNIQNHLEFTYGQDANNNSVYEPRADRRGDAARAMFYEMVSYNGLSGNWGLNSLLSFATEQDQNTLKLWNQQDPPDKFERTKNEYIHSLQNNRNPFIDHPAWANCINFDSLIKTSLCGALSGIEEEQLSKAKIYPNPASDVLHISLPEELHGKVELTVCDLLGKPLLQSTFSTGDMTIPLAEYPNGGYLLKMEANDKTIYRKFFVAH